MNYTIYNVIASIAKLIHEGFPSYEINVSAVPQGVTTPCFFISFMPSTSAAQVDNRIYNELNVDIVFLQAPNEINATSTAYAVVEYLNENLETIPYFEEANNYFMYNSVPERTGYLHSYNRNSHFEDMDLHYQLTIKARGHFEVTETLMEELEAITYEIKIN